mmetsp:Transcript_73259/g.161750  ORF Transcript_73259/g.161750 Transcript_73259/m.161750 type:complete len:166 (-) Transcript_73259:330-827(-)
MACYWGCETTGNRITWGIIITFLLVGIGLLCGGAIGGTLGGGTNCFDVYTDCTDARGSSMEARDFCASAADDECNFILWVSLLAAGLACIVLGGLLPMIYFAFSKDPDDDDEDLPVYTAEDVKARTLTVPGSYRMRSNPVHDYGMIMPRPPSGPPPPEAILPDSR